MDTVMGELRKSATEMESLTFMSDLPSYATGFMRNKMAMHERSDNRRLADVARQIRDRKHNGQIAYALRDS
jgi:hypothetical protein